MMRWSVVAVLCAALVGCGDDGRLHKTEQQPDALASDGANDDTGILVGIAFETIYEVEGVRVVVENHNGPSQGRMLQAVYIFRKEVRELFELEEEDEQAIWESIAEIRWDDELVAPVGGTYDFDSAKLLLEYHGCIVDPPLFQLLTLHYYHAETGGTELNDFLTAWSEGLAAGNTELCAPEE